MPYILLLLVLLIEPLFLDVPYAQGLDTSIWHSFIIAVAAGIVSIVSNRIDENSEFEDELREYEDEIMREYRRDND